MRRVVLPVVQVHSTPEYWLGVTRTTYAEHRDDDTAQRPRRHVEQEQVPVLAGEDVYPFAHVRPQEIPVPELGDGPAMLGGEMGDEHSG